MIEIEKTSTGTLLFLNCGCSAWRHMSHPSGAAALVEIIQPCSTHAAEGTRWRAVPKGETVNTWVKAPVQMDPIRPR
jgi:hypothetical protein